MLIFRKIQQKKQHNLPFNLLFSSPLPFFLILHLLKREKEIKLPNSPPLLGKGKIKKGKRFLISSEEKREIKKVFQNIYF